MQQYKEILADIIQNGVIKDDRTGIGTISRFGTQKRYDLQEGFPLLTLKRTDFKPIVHELLWFLSGSTDNDELVEQGVNIWTPWAASNGELGPIYGAQWRNWLSPATRDYRSLWARLKSAWRGEATPPDRHDQIFALIRTLRENPKSRRMLVTGWNPGVLPIEGLSHETNVMLGKQVLPPCHTIFQFDASPLSWKDHLQYLVSQGRIVSMEAGLAAIDVAVRNKTEATVDAARIAWLMYYYDADEAMSWEALPVRKYRLNCQLFQRSADTAIGTPYNIASYALLTMLVAQCVDMLPGEFIHTTGDTHLYLNHLDAAKLMLEREDYPLPQVILNPNIKELDDFTFEDIELVNYVSHPRIRLEVAV